jgi:hypothetical protein
MPSHHSHQKNPNRNKEHGPRPEHKGYSTSEAILALKDNLVEEIQASREQGPSPESTPKWITYATLLFVFLTTVGVGIQDLILHSSDDTFKDTLVAQKKSSEQQLRAYVGMAPGDVDDFGIMGKQRIKFVRKNYGTTPAYNVGFSKIGLSIIKPGEVINTGESACLNPVIAGQITMFPTVELPWSLTINKSPDVAAASAEKMSAFSPAQFQLVKSGDMIFVYWGTACYQDAFGTAHFTNYCWMYKGASMTSKDADACLTHNDSN